ncbi:MAG: hypothetical protein IPP71_22765 [Bacteroidetes bacterium]|nr:hypothetical protein [Bacteroidota bacterium]
MDPRDPEFCMVYSSPLPHKINIVKAVLEDNQIKSFEVNRKDSSYIFIGDIDLYVYESDAVLAKFLIKNK